MRSLCVSINGHERRWDFNLRRIDSNSVLQRPLENTPFIRTWFSNGGPCHDATCTNGQVPMRASPHEFGIASVCNATYSGLIQPSSHVESIEGGSMWNKSQSEVPGTSTPLQETRV